MMCNQPEFFSLCFFKCLVFFTYVEGRHTKIVNGVIDLEVMKGEKKGIKKGRTNNKNKSLKICIYDATEFMALFQYDFHEKI